ncbi:hypothetical protein AB0D66_33340 [Streptomyces sp. NPDC048270]|uniref:hypothetical protein n=1 Tax=Streptomyces sp. NPDC048270 TaxID=3154615 RepID=UPI0033EB965F
MSEPVHPQLLQRLRTVAEVHVPGHGQALGHRALLAVGFNLSFALIVQDRSSRAAGGPETERGVALRDEDVVPVALTARQHNEILATEILPTWTAHAVPQDQPVVIVVAGPAGAGKSRLCDLLLAVLARWGGAIFEGDGDAPENTFSAGPSRLAMLKLTIRATLRHYRMRGRTFPFTAPLLERVNKPWP